MKASGSLVEVERVHVGAGLDLPGDQVLHGRRRAGCPTAIRNRTSGTIRGSPGPSAPARRRSSGEDSSQPSSGHARGGAQRPDERAGQDVVGGDVAELVGGDRLDLVVGEPLEHRVVDDDPAGRAEAGDVGVQRRRPPAGVRRPARPAPGCRSSRPARAGRCAGCRPASSSNRLKAGSMSTGQRKEPTTTRRGGTERRPRPTRSAARGGRARPGPSSRQRGQAGVDRRRHRDVAQPQPPAAGGQAVAVADDLGVGRQRQRDQPADDRQGQDAEEDLPDPAAAQRAGDRRTTSRPPRGVSAEDARHTSPRSQGEQRGGA